MVNKQKEARDIAKDILNYSRAKGYGLGECGYYFDKAENDLLDRGVSEKEAKEIIEMAEELANKADDINATLN